MIKKEVIEFESTLAVKSKMLPKMLYSYIRNKQLNNRITTLTSGTGEDMSTSAEIANSLNTYFQSLIVKDNEVDHILTRFAQRIFTSCDDDVNTIFSQEALH